MKIVITTHQFLPEFSGGTEILAFETAMELRARGHEVTVFTACPATTALSDVARFDHYEIEGMRVIRFRHSYVPMGNQSSVLELEYNNHLVGSYFGNYLRQEKPHVVHFFHLARLSGSLVDACYEAGIPTVFTPTDFWFICPTSQLRLLNDQPCRGPDKSSVNCVRHIAALNYPAAITEKLQRLPDWLVSLLIFLMKHGLPLDRHYSAQVHAFAWRREFLAKRMNLLDRIAVPTPTMMSLLTRNGLQITRTIAIPFGLNLKYLQNVRRPAPDPILRIGYIGALSHHKGVHVLVKAVKGLVGRPLQLTIHGKLDDFPAYVRELREMAEGDARITFLGTFPNREIGAVFSKLDVLVVPSLWYENSPLVIYSAQAAKCPVIASNLGGLADVIRHGENGLLFEAGNVGQLQAAIDALLNDEALLPSLSHNAKAPLGMPEYVDRLLEIYAELFQTAKPT